MLLAIGSFLRRWRLRDVVAIGANSRAAAALGPRARLRLRQPSDEVIRELRASPQCDEILLAPAPEQMHALPELLRELQSVPVPVRVALEVPGAAAARRDGEFVVISIGAAPADRFGYAIGKRLLDVVFALIALVAAAPLALAIAMGIKICSPGPVLFRQQRIGAAGRHFTLYKFRTLPVRPDEISDRDWIATAPAHAGCFGRWLRLTGLDEWPQFWNVLRGDMSVVGPRPERPHFADGFGDALEAYRLRQRLKPGITGWAQIHGFTGDSSISKRLEYDLDYLRNWSLALDLKILARTPAQTLRRCRMADHARSI